MQAVGFGTGASEGAPVGASASTEKSDNELVKRLLSKSHQESAKQDPARAPGACAPVKPVGDAAPCNDGNLKPYPAAAHPLSGS